MVNFLYKPNLSDFVSSWFFTYRASERLCGRDMTIEVPIKSFHIIKKNCKLYCLPVIVTEDVVLVVGRVFADRPADEAGRAVLVAVLLDRGHVGVLLDRLWAVQVSRHTIFRLLLGHLLIHNWLLGWFLLFKMTLLVKRKGGFGLESKKQNM